METIQRAVRKLLTSPKKPLGEEMEAFIESRGKILPPTAVTGYRGVVQNGVFALVYLLKRSPGDCAVVASLDRTLRLILQNENLQWFQIRWEDIGFVWQNGELFVPYQFQEAAARCLSRQPRFLLALCTLVRGDVIHANILLYDTLLGELERFDPYEKQSSVFQTRLLDENLKQVFQQLPGFQVMVTPPDIRGSIRKGLQARAEAEGEQHPQDPWGFCQPWTILYADARLALPNQDRSSFPELFQAMARRHGGSLTRLIRSYAEAMNQTKIQLQTEFLLNEPSYQQYTDPRVPLYALLLQELQRSKTLVT